MNKGLGSEQLYILIAFIHTLVHLRIVPNHEEGAELYRKAKDLL